MNNESAVFSGLSSLLRANVLTPICTYLQTRQQQGPITVDELATVLKLPAASSSPVQTTSFGSMPGGFPAAANFPGMPPTLTGFAGMPMPLDSQKKTRSKSSFAQPAADHERCIYLITRGANKGNRCTNKFEPGIQYCTQHKGTRAAQTAMQQGGGMTQVGQSMLPMPGMVGLPSVPTMTPMPAAQPQHPKLQVHQVAPGLYREANQGLAIKTGTTPNEYIACGVFSDPKTTTITPLTSDKIEYCRQIGLAYVDPSKPGESIVKPSALPSPSGNVTGQTFPAMAQQLPTLPSVLPGMSMVSGLPQVQPLAGIGSMPGSAMSDMHGIDDPNDDDLDDGEDE